MQPLILLTVTLFPLSTIGAASGSVNDQSAPHGVRVITPQLRVDFDHREVILDTEVVFREGPLELLICPKRTKEHESILAAEIDPRVFQLALLMVGAVPGTPARWTERRGPDGQPASEVIPPSGQRLRIWLELSKNGKPQRLDARQWIRDAAGKPLAADFVFTGSGFTKIPGVDRPVFMANDGDLVCVANFPGSVVDIAMKSSKDNAELLFEAWTERIPEKGTKVRVIFQPIPEKKKSSGL